MTFSSTPDPTEKDFARMREIAGELDRLKPPSGKIIDGGLADRLLGYQQEYGALLRKYELADLPVHTLKARLWPEG